MPNPAYRAADYLEKRIKNHLEANGYIVWQTRGSKSPVDLIAAKPRQLLFVQVKGGLTWISGEEWNALLQCAIRAGAVPVLAFRHVHAGRLTSEVRYWRITHAHTSHTRDWPAVDWTVDDVELNAAMTRHPAGKHQP